MQINKKYSYKDFTHRTFKNVSTSEFDNTIIAGSCFYQEAREKDAKVEKNIFPDGMNGVVFKGCNLDNVKIPSGNTVEGSCTHKKIKVQNDWDNWFLNGASKPIKPMNEKQRLEKGISISPKDIPVKKFTEEEREQFEKLFEAEEE